jgi:hypothetical protein
MFYRANTPEKIRYNGTESEDRDKTKDKIKSSKERGVRSECRWGEKEED